jgi:hypothetical protein
VRADRNPAFARLLRAAPAEPPCAARSFFVCDTGGVLNRVTHFYSFPSLAARADIRKSLAANAQWQSYIDQARPFVAHQARPAAACHLRRGSN